MSPRIVLPHPVTLSTAICGLRLGSHSQVLRCPERPHRPLVGLVTQAESAGSTH